MARWCIYESLSDLSDIKSEYVTRTSTKDFGGSGMCDRTMLCQSKGMIWLFFITEKNSTPRMLRHAGCCKANMQSVVVLTVA